MGALDRFFSGMRASATGLTAERIRVDVIAKNIANANTTSMPDGSGPYTRQIVSFAPLLEKASRGPGGAGETVVSGVQVKGVVDDTNTPYEIIHDPGHPDADAQGNVALPNVTAVREMADLMLAMRAYESNLKAQETFIRMADSALRLMQR